MKNRIIALVVGIVLLLFSSLLSQITFERWYGGPAFDAGYDGAQSSTGSYALVGASESFGAIMMDVCLIKTDSMGNIVWARTYGGADWDGGNSICPTIDQGYILTGFTQSYGAGATDVYIIRVDSLGDTLWTKVYGGTDMDYPMSVSTCSNGGYIVAGWTHSFGSGFSDAYLIRTDSLGDTLWTEAYGGADFEFAYSVSQTADKDYIIVGSTDTYGSGGWDVYLIKADSLGDTLWTKTYGGSYSEEGWSIALTSDGGFMIVGWTDSLIAGADDVLAIKVDSLGNIQWTKTYGGSDNERAWCVSQTTDDGYIIAGYTDSFGAGGNDLYLIKTDSLGDTIFTQTYGGGEEECGYHISQTADLGYIAVGFTRSFGAGSHDFYFIKTDSAGSVGIVESDQRLETRRGKLRCYPNPFTTVTTIDLLGVRGNTKRNLTIYDSAGRLVKSVQLTTSTNQLGADLPPGIYFLKLNGKPVGKVVKVR
jgi:hypothetical protein